MKYIGVAKTAAKWGVSERSVRDYCAQGRVNGAFLKGKTWQIPADANKPKRKNAKNCDNELLVRLRQEKQARMPGGIYHKLQIELTYNSNHIEGSKLSKEQTQLIFETKTICVGFGAASEFVQENVRGNMCDVRQDIMYESSQVTVSIDDIIETNNHFKCVDYVIDTCTKPLTQKYIKRLHEILKTGTSDAEKDWFSVGDYKILPNEVGSQQTAAPKDVSKEMEKLLQWYNKGTCKSEAVCDVGKRDNCSAGCNVVQIGANGINGCSTYDADNYAVQDAARSKDGRTTHDTNKDVSKLIEFHVCFEKIHPFQDGNGRVGRLILLKECLANNVVPFIIFDELKSFYYRGLREYDTERGYLTDTCLYAQDTFKKWLDYFEINY